MKTEDTNIENIMHPAPHTIGSNQTLEVALKTMNSHNIRHLPVLDAGELKGVITDRDIQFALAFEKADANELKIRDCYTDEPYIVSPSTKVSEVTKYMAHKHIGCALVVDNKKLKGIFTTVDACRMLSEVLCEKAEQ